MEKFEMTRLAAGAALSAQAIGVLAIVLCAFLALSLATAGRYSLFIDADALRIQSVLYNTKVSLSDIDAEGVRSVDLDAEGIRMKLRTNGIGLPGLQVGWFTDGVSKYKLYVTDRRKVVLIPVKSGYTILFSSPEAGKIAEMLRRKQ